METVGHDDSRVYRRCFSLRENRVTPQCQYCRRWACDTRTNPGGPFRWARAARTDNVMDTDSRPAGIAFAARRRKTLHWKRLARIPRSSNGRTAAFGAVNRGSNPCRGANHFGYKLAVLSCLTAALRGTSVIPNNSKVFAGADLSGWRGRLWEATLDGAVNKQKLSTAKIEV